MPRLHTRRMVGREKELEAIAAAVAEARAGHPILLLVDGPGEVWSARSSGMWHGTNRPPLRPDLRPGEDPRRPRSRGLWTRNKRHPESNDAV